MIFWKNKKVLVTGATGFIGSNLVKKLVDLDADVTALVRNQRVSSGNLKYLIGDISKDNFNFKEFEYVFHLAAIVGVVKCNEDAELAERINVKGTQFLLESVKGSENLKKFIYTSTANVYGNQAFPTRETSHTEPIDFYAQTKLKGERIVLDYQGKYNLPITIARISNIYGAGQKLPAAVPNIIKTIQETEEGGEITVGKATRDFVSIEDVITGLLTIAEKGEGIYNLGSGKETSIKTVAQTIINYLNKPLIVREKPVKEMKRCFLDTTKINSLGWFPHWKLEEGLKQILENE